MWLTKLLPIALLPAAVCSASTVLISFNTLPTVYQNGSYNGFAGSTVNGVPNQLLMCDDSASDSYVPSYNLVFNYSNLTSQIPLQFARFQTANPAAQTTQYEEAAVLLYQLNQAGPNASANFVTDIQYAVWNLMEPPVVLVPGREAQEHQLQTSALALVNNASQTTFLQTSVYPFLNIYTPTAPYASNQEFLQYAPGVPGVNNQQLAPEPGTASMMALLLAVGTTAALRRNRAGRE